MSTQTVINRQSHAAEAARLERLSETPGHSGYAIYAAAHYSLAGMDDKAQACLDVVLDLNYPRDGAAHELVRSGAHRLAAQVYGEYADELAGLSDGAVRAQVGRWRNTPLDWRYTTASELQPQAVAYFKELAAEQHALAGISPGVRQTETQANYLTL